MLEELQKKVNDLTAENATYKAQSVQSQAGIEGLLSQIEAHREQVNEFIVTSLNLRANLMQVKKHNNKLNSQIAELQKQVESLNKQLAENSKLIEELKTSKAA